MFKCISILRNWKHLKDSAHDHLHIYTFWMFPRTWKFRNLQMFICVLQIKNTFHCSERMSFSSAISCAISLRGFEYIHESQFEDFMAFGMRLHATNPEIHKKIMGCQSENLANYCAHGSKNMLMSLIRLFWKFRFFRAGARM